MMNEKIRFVLVGFVNTAVDFAVLFVLVGIGMMPFAANILSTSAALLTSFVLNKKAVFRDTERGNYRQFTLFIVVTLAGIWGLQGLVIVVVNEAAQAWLHMEGAGVLLAGKVIATFFSLTWNYLWYSRVVFRQRNHSEK